MMKASRIFAAAALMALALLSVGCKKHSWQSGVGTPVQFRVESGSTASKADTKTAYSGNNIAVGESTYDRLDWISGDKIAIFMAYEDAESFSILDYRVGSPTADGRKSQASVSAVGQAHTWQGEGNHFFGAVYPSPSVKAQSETWQNVLDIYNPLLTYPATQILTPKGSTGADALTLLPDMDYAYMFSLSPFNSVEDGPVTLSFIPVFTAFEIEISAGENESLDLTGFKLVSHNDDEPVACVKNIYTDEITNGSQEVSVDLTGTTLEQNGAPLVLTVFATGGYVASVNFSSLSLEFTGNQIGTRTLDLKQNGEWITFAGNVKHRITGLYFPKLDDASAGGQGINWGGMSGDDLGWNGADGEDINWGGNKPYALPGVFTVSAGKQVKFSRGNLVYKAGEWDLQKQQYDRCFTENGVLDLTETSTFDLFGWATAGIAAADGTMVNYQPWSFNDQKNNGASNPYGYGPSIENVPAGNTWGAYADCCDWGNNPVLAQKIGTGWFTMSAAEWTYLFCGRTGISTVNGVTDARFVKATVHGLPGLLIFSDGFGDAYTGDQSIFLANSINQENEDASDFSDIVLSDLTWTKVEAAGAVFLTPTGAMMDGKYLYVNEGDVYLCAIWSSTVSSEEAVYVFGNEGKVLLIDNTHGATQGEASRFWGLAVRLVKLAE